MADTVNVTTNLDDSYDVETEIMNTPASHMQTQEHQNELHLHPQARRRLKGKSLQKNNPQAKRNQTSQNQA